MKSKILKWFLSMICVVVFGLLAIIETGIEMIYQLVRLIKHGYEGIIDLLLKLVKPVYDDELKTKTETKEVNNSEDCLKVYEYSLEED